MLKMSQNVSECIKMCAEWIVKMFYAWNYLKGAVVTVKWAKIGDLGAKIAHFLKDAQNASICIKMHQNLCRMNCANVLCTKSSKKWFSLHFNRVKLTNYFLHFVFADPVCINKLAFLDLVIYLIKNQILRSYLSTGSSITKSHK